jgi:hypothetical protein
VDELERENSFIIVASHIKAYTIILVLGIPPETWGGGLFAAGVITDPGGFYPGFPGSYPEIVIIFFMYPGKNDLGAQAGACFTRDGGRIFYKAIGTRISFSVLAANIFGELFNEILILFNEFHFPGRHFYRHVGFLSGVRIITGWREKRGREKEYGLAIAPAHIIFRGYRAGLTLR